MTEGKTWLLMPLTSKTTLKEMKSLVYEMPQELHVRSFPARKNDLRIWIEQRRKDYWNTQQAQIQNRSHGKQNSKVRCEIPASEVNKFLRELPPFGEEAPNV